MVHFTCDLCGKELTGSGESRYVVKIEAYPGFDPTEIKEDDLDDDPMEAVAQILQRDEALVSGNGHAVEQSVHVVLKELIQGIHETPPWVASILNT